MRLVRLEPLLFTSLIGYLKALEKICVKLITRRIAHCIAKEKLVAQLPLRIAFLRKQLTTIALKIHKYTISSCW